MDRTSAKKHAGIGMTRRAMVSLRAVRWPALLACRSTYREYMLTVPRENIDTSGMNTLATLIDSKSTGEKINNMIWRVLDTTNTDLVLFTSDRPIVRTNGLMREHGHLALAIGPKRLFLATQNEQTLSSILRTGHGQLVRNYNKQVVSCAVRFVYGTSDSQIGFVGKHMSTDHQPRLIETLARKQDEISRMITSNDDFPL